MAALRWQREPHEWLLITADGTTDGYKRHYRPYMLAWALWDLAVATLRGW